MFSVTKLQTAKNYPFLRGGGYASHQQPGQPPHLHSAGQEHHLAPTGACLSLPETNSSPLKIDGCKTSFLSGPGLFSRLLLFNFRGVCWTPYPKFLTNWTQNGQVNWGFGAFSEVYVTKTRYILIVTKKEQIKGKELVFQTSFFRKIYQFSDPTFYKMGFGKSTL